MLIIEIIWSQKHSGSQREFWINTIMVSKKIVIENIWGQKFRSIKFLAPKRECKSKNIGLKKYISLMLFQVPMGGGEFGPTNFR